MQTAGEHLTEEKGAVTFERFLFYSMLLSSGQKSQQKGLGNTFETQINVDVVSISSTLVVAILLSPFFMNVDG